MKRSILITACLLLILLPLGTMLVRADAPQEVVIQIAAKVRQYNLGNPRAESPRPNQTPAPRNQGYWQAFERGWVYWSPSTGAHVVNGDIFAKWASLRWEQGQLGFPTTDEVMCAGSGQGDRYQRFEGGIIFWGASTRQTTVYPDEAAFRRSGVCMTGDTATPSAACGRLRVTLTGFTVHRETWDDALERDGRRDEVYLLSQTRVTNGSRTIYDSGTMRSRVMGDAYQRSDRVAAGTAYRYGGLKTGDSFPGRPYFLSGAPTRDRAPMGLFDRSLGPGEVLTIVPTIWEWDGPDDFITLYGRIVNPILDFGHRYVPGTPSPAGLLADILMQAGDIGSDARVGRGVLGDPRDRPIGMYLSSDFYEFRPQMLRMDCSLAARASQYDFGFGPGVIPVRYTDCRDLRGDYTLFVLVERLP